MVHFLSSLYLFLENDEEKEKAPTDEDVILTGFHIASSWRSDSGCQLGEVCEV